MDKEAERVFRRVVLDDLSQIRQFVRETAVSTGSDQGTAQRYASPAIDELIVAVNEAVANIIRHGYQNKSGDITVNIACYRKTIRVTLRDNSPGFDPTTVLSPDMTLPLAERPFGGMGVHMMREFCDEIRYQRNSRGENELTLLKQMSADK